MKKQFRPVIKHDVVTQTYTIRDKNGVVIQVPDVIIDRLDTHYNTLEAQRIALSHSYREVLEENEELERENKKYRIRAENAMELAERANCEVLRLERENEKLKGDG